MARIKGKYVATVVIDFDYQDENMAAVSELKNVMQNGLFSKAVKAGICEATGVKEFSTVSVETQFADLYRVEEETE